jgi:hypothetical protein
MGISRRAVMNGMGQSATLGALAAYLPAQLQAADAAAPAAAPAAAAAAPVAPAGPTTYCYTRIYQRGDGLSFDGDVFSNRTVSNMIKAYGKDALRIELRMPVVPAGAPTPKIIAAVSIWFRDVGGFLKTHQAAAKDLAAEMERVTKAPPADQVDEVILALGDDRTLVPKESYVYSTYFPSKTDGTINTDFFAGTFYPKIWETYGAAAVRRIELTKAATPKSMVVAATHVYIADPDAYDAATEKSRELFKELAGHTNIAPVETLATVYAFG